MTAGKESLFGNLWRTLSEAPVQLWLHLAAGYRSLLRISSSGFGWIENISARRLWRAVLVVNLLVLLGSAWLAIKDSEGQISIHARSEIWSLTLEHGDQVPTLLNAGTPLVRSAECDGTFSEIQFAEFLENGSTFRFSRSAEGNIIVGLEPVDEAMTYALGFCEDGSVVEIKGPRRFEIPLSDTLGVTFLARGQISVGALAVDNGVTSSALLTEGTVRASALSFPSRSGRVEEVHELMLGDMVEFTTSDDQTEVHLLARALPTDGDFELVTQSLAESAEVRRLGLSEIFRISAVPSIWQRMQAEPIWVYLLFLGLIMSNTMSALWNYKQSAFGEQG